MNTIRWGIIGCGDVTEIKSGPAFQRARGSALVAVMRRDGKKAADYARRHRVPRWYDDAAALVADPEVDAVYVATPPSSHKEYTLMVAAAGKPVYVEKPMALDEAECRAMIEGCRAAGVPLFVAYYRRALPRFVAAKMLLDEGAIGQVRLVTIVQHQSPGAAERDTERLPWRVRPEMSGGGLFVDMGCHTLDLLDFILGPIERAVGEARNLGGLYRAEDTVTARLTFASGVPAVGSWCFVAGETREEVEIVGSQGRLAYSLFTEAPVRLVREGRAEERVIPHPPHVQEPLIQAVVDQLIGHGQCPSTGASALRTTRIIDRILGRPGA